MKYISDDELIYLIKQDNKEAEELLFFRYKTNSKLINSIVKPYMKLILDDNEIESKLVYSLKLSLSSYGVEKGRFINYFSTVFYREVFKEYQEKTGIFDIYTPVEFDENLMTQNYSLHDDSLDGVNALDALKEYNEEYYRIVYLWLNGETYKSISDIINCEPRQIEYKLHKAISYLRNLFVKK
jgi:hypothetical protein